MNHTLFISDLHLQSTRPDITHAFFAFLQNQATKADALYILGDLFAAWIGDDDVTEFNESIFAALRALVAKGVPVFFMRGNRDFLIGSAFAKATGCQLLPDPTKIELYGTQVLLTHGDALCTDDPRHQAFRRYSQDPKWNRYFLALPLVLRKAIARILRWVSYKHGKKIAGMQMDVVPEAVQHLMEQHNVQLLIHGHTHKPQIHSLMVNNLAATRIVLGDWGPNGQSLYYGADGHYRLF